MFLAGLQLFGKQQSSHHVYSSKLKTGSGYEEPHRVNELLQQTDYDTASQGCLHIVMPACGNVVI